MPEISRFLGIVVQMYFEDHLPPHFHARYGEFRIKVFIQSGVVEGRFPPRALRHLMEWYDLHRAELQQDWELASHGEDPLPIAPGMTMLVHVTEAQHRGGHRVWLRFSDGLEGEIDLSTALRGPVFQPLKDPDYFASFHLDDTLTWPNGADYAPEFLYDRVLAAGGRRG